METAVILKINENVSKGIPCALVTVTESKGSTPAKTGAMMCVAENGDITGTVGGGRLEHQVIELAVESIKKGESLEADINLKQDAGMTCGGAVRVFIRVFVKSNILYIVGAGHIGKELYKLANHLGMRSIIIDDRAEFAVKSEFPEAVDVVCRDIAEALKSYNLGRDSYVAIATRSHKTDREALEAVIESDAAYIGMIGSSSKIREIFGALRENGVSEELLKKTYTPMGLNIATTEPKEIAFSIMSEILLVKNGGTSAHMRDVKKLL